MLGSGFAGLCLELGAVWPLIMGTEAQIEGSWRV